MKKLLLLSTLLFSAYTNANEVYVDATVASKHFCKCEAITNERNFGLGLTYEFSDKFNVKGGLFRNSYSKNSAYAFIGYNPFVSHIGNFKVIFGLNAGLVSGYDGTPAESGVVIGKFRAGVIPSLSLEYKPSRFRASLFTPGPSVVALQLSFGLGNN